MITDWYCHENIEYILVLFITFNSKSFQLNFSLRKKKPFLNKANLLFSSSKCSFQFKGKVFWTQHLCIICTNDFTVVSCGINPSLTRIEKNIDSDVSCFNTQQRKVHYLQNCTQLLSLFLQRKIGKNCNTINQYFSLKILRCLN